MQFAIVDPNSEIGHEILSSYGSEMKSRYGAGAPYGPLNVPEGVNGDGGAFIVAFSDDGLRVIGCLGVRRLSGGTEIAELKAMYVRESHRRTGVAKGMLEFAEDWMRSQGYAVSRLNTGLRQPEALKLYRQVGYEEIERYNDNPLAAYWFEKRL